MLTGKHAFVDAMVSMSRVGSCRTRALMPSGKPHYRGLAPHGCGVGNRTCLGASFRARRCARVVAADIDAPGCTSRLYERTGRRTAGLDDDRTARHTSYRVSQRHRKRIEEIFGWLKTVGRLRKSHTLHRYPANPALCLPCGKCLQPAADAETGATAAAHLIAPTVTPMCPPTGLNSQRTITLG
jgi:hypothetical protein